MGTRPGSAPTAACAPHANALSLARDEVTRHDQMRGEINMQLDAHKEQLSALHKHVEILTEMCKPDPVAPAPALAEGEEGVDAPRRRKRTTNASPVAPEIQKTAGQWKAWTTNGPPSSASIVPMLSPVDMKAHAVVRSS